MVFLHDPFLTNVELGTWYKFYQSLNAAVWNGKEASIINHCSLENLCFDYQRVQFKFNTSVLGSREFILTTLFCLSEDSF